MITVKEYFMGRDERYPNELTTELRINAQDIVNRVNDLLVLFGQTRKVNSGWRPQVINEATPGAAIKSKHMTCQAVDLEDADGDLDEWAMTNTWALENCGLWMEHPAATKGWAHFQTVPPKSGRRVFYP